jgi:predicted  nucleic acid-binding Zn-ribbon protein
MQVCVNTHISAVVCFSFQIFLSSEVEAMAKIIQDLESQLAKSQEEIAGLTKSLEELDEQHQDAIG